MAAPGQLQRRRGAPALTDAAALDRRRTIADWMIPAGVALVAVACFLPTLRNDFVLWDDDLNFTDNPSYRGLSWRQLRWMFTTVHGGHYQPLSWVTLGLDYTLWGMNPAGYHLTSVLLHAANAVLFYHVVLALLRRAAVSGPALVLEGAAAVGALFFAIHPLRVESVAWASERRDVLSSLFYLATVLAYLRMAEEEGSGRARRWYLVSLACFVLSLLSQAWASRCPSCSSRWTSFRCGERRAFWRRRRMRRSPPARRRSRSWPSNTSPRCARWRSTAPSSAPRRRPTGYASTSGRRSRPGTCRPPISSRGASTRRRRATC